MSKDQTGESGGGAYPRPEHEASPKAGDFKGGQSDQAYYGKGQLGDKELDGNENAPSTEQ
jgi:hypothetical protein